MTKGLLNSTLTALLLSTFFVPGDALAGPPQETLLGWARGLLAIARDRAAHYNTLSLTVDQSPTAANERAMVEVRTSDRLHKFGSLLAMASGPSDSSRGKNRDWTIRFPVSLRVPTLVESHLASAPEPGPAVTVLQEFLARHTAIRPTQLQLRQAKEIAELPGMKGIPYSLTAVAASESALLETMAALTAAHVHVTLHRLELAPAGSEILGTFSGRLLVKARPGSDGISRQAAEAAATQALASAGNPPQQMVWNQLPDKLRLQLELEARGVPEAWQTLERLVSIPGLSAFEILELRIDTRGRPGLSGLLYF